MKTCLVVDDSHVVRKVARRIFEDLGFACEEAEDGNKATEACKWKMPDAILLDWNMPAMSGIEFLETLRTLEGGEHPKVVLCTTENDLSLMQRALDAGANEYVMKPFDNEIIHSKFREIGLIEG